MNTKELRMNFSEAPMLNDLYEKHFYLNQGVSFYEDKIRPSFMLLLQKLSGFNTSNIFVTNGSDEALFLLSQATLFPENNIFFNRTFMGHKYACEFSKDRQCIELNYIISRNKLCVDYKEDAFRNSVIYLCDPHNPTGMKYDEKWVMLLISKLSELGSILVIDQAYFEFSYISYMDALSDFVQKGSVVLVRTLSKFWGMAGLRIGYIVASEEIISNLMYVKKIIPYSSSSVSIEIASRILSEEGIGKKVGEIHKNQKNKLRNILINHKLVHYPSSTNFFMFKTPFFDESDVFGSNYKIDSAMSLEVIGFPGWLRVSTGSDEALSCFSRNLRELFKSKNNSFA